MVDWVSATRSPIPEVPSDIFVSVIQIHLEVDVEVGAVGTVVGDVGGAHVVYIHGAAEVDGAGADIVGVRGHIGKSIDMGHEAAVALQCVGGVADVDAGKGVVCISG